MGLDISPIFFFMPVFSFFFVSVVVYAILVSTKVLGDSKGINLFISFLMAVIFLSFASLEKYLITILPWFVILIVMVFLILLIAGFVGGKADWIMKPSFGWVIVAVLIIIFLIAAIKVFNPVFDPDLIITSGDDGSSGFSNFWDYLFYSRWSGSILLIILAGIVSWVLTKK